MTGAPRPGAIIGRALIVSATVMLVLAVAFAARLAPLDPAMRWPVALVLGLVAVVDSLIGLWFLRRNT